MLWGVFRPFLGLVEHVLPIECYVITCACMYFWWLYDAASPRTHAQAYRPQNCTTQLKTRGLLVFWLLLGVFWGRSSTFVLCFAMCLVPNCGNPSQMVRDKSHDHPGALRGPVVDVLLHIAAQNTFKLWCCTSWDRYLIVHVWRGINREKKML
jgi:hypothetical protein